MKKKDDLTRFIEEQCAKDPEFKAAYRDALNELGERLDEAEQQRVFDEVRAAYGFNTRTFIDLDRARAAAATA